MRKLVRHSVLAMIAVAVSVGVIFTSGVRVSGQLNKPTPTIDQWLSLKAILKREASPRISPDGGSVAYSIRTPVRRLARQ